MTVCVLTEDEAEWCERISLWFDDSMLCSWLERMVVVVLNNA